MKESESVPGGEFDMLMGLGAYREGNWMVPVSIRAEELRYVHSFVPLRQ